jgi:putative colanic acid biosynthesis acetyltransferase WcaF
MKGTVYEDNSSVKIIPLASAPGSRTSWGKPAPMMYAWGVAERLFVTNPWQISSGLRRKVLRMFGAEIGEGVILRPGLRVTAPWRLVIGDDCWIGDGVWLHNQDRIEIGSNVVVSQGSFLTTGSHAYKTDMGLLTKPIVVESGAWITSRVIILGGTRVGRSALVAPGSVASGSLVEGQIYQGNPARSIGPRFGPPRSSLKS